MSNTTFIDDNHVNFETKCVGIVRETQTQQSGLQCFIWYIIVKSNNAFIAGAVKSISQNIYTFSQWQPSEN